MAAGNLLTVLEELILLLVAGALVAVSGLGLFPLIPEKRS